MRALPVQANLEQLKKQAKDLLTAYRAGDATAVAEVTRHERSPDPSTFALHDAQRVLARSYGFESWAKLKEGIERVTMARLADAVRRGDARLVRSMLGKRPELVHMEMAGNDEHTALHHAVLARNAEMVRILMGAGANARKGIWPHRDATGACTIARERGYDEIVAVIEEEERYRREAMSCPNATISPTQDRLNAAIRSGESDTALAILRGDESLIGACDGDGGTPLHVAAAAVNDTLVAWLLDKGANVRKKDVKGLTPLDRAAVAADPRNDKASRFPAVAQRLLRRGAPPTLRAAVALGDADRVRELLEEDPAMVREPKAHVLSLAVKHGQLEMVRLLLDLGADVDERGMLSELEEPTMSWGEPLWHAALAGRRDIAELLLDRGADPNANVYASGWPIDHACARKDEEMKRLLLGRGARLQPWTVTKIHDVEEARRMLAADDSEELASELVWGSCLNGCPGIVELALPRLRWPADDPRWHWILIQPIRGHDRAEHEGLFACMRLLVRHGIDVNAARRMDATVLHYTAADGDPTPFERVRLADLLLDAGARLDIRDHLLKSTPLGWAARWGRREMVQRLLERGAPASEPEAEPWATPLAWATKHGHIEIAAMLRERGAAA